MMTRLRRVAALSIAVLAGSLAARAQDIDPADLFASAKSAYEQKKYGKALQELHLLVGEISKMRLAGLKSALAAAVRPEGWTPGEASGDAMASQLVFGAAGITVRQEFSNGEKRVDVELVCDSPAVSAVAPLLSNPALVQGQENTSIVTLQGGRRAILEYEPAEKQGNLKVLLNNNTALLTFEGSQVDRKDLLEVFGKKADLDALEKALQN